MSAIGGMLMFGGGTVDRHQLTALGERLDRLGPDGGHEVVAGRVGMAYRALHTTAESRRERQPCCRDQHAVLCFNGRIDNRDELLTQLRDDLQGDDTDAAIVMAAYLRWRREGIAKLVGDFALALWDRRDHAVWLARDCVGTRTLFYHVDGDRVAWSTDIGALLDVFGIPVVVDERYVAELLTHGTVADRTPYEGVRTVAPACIVRIDEDGLVSEQRFWSLDSTPDIRYSTDAEYEEHFRAAFREAVRARLRTDRPVFAELSGGLDSSSIVCMGDEVLAAGDAPVPAVHTLSYVADEAPSSDERKWIRHVEEWRGSAGHHVLESEYPFLTPAPSTERFRLPTWLYCSAAYELRVRELMRAAGAVCLLSGHGGDHLLYSWSNPGPYLVDLFRARRPLSLHHALLAWSGVTHTPYSKLALGTVFHRLHPQWLEPAGVQGAASAGWNSSREHAILAFERAARHVSSGFRQELEIQPAYPFLDRRLVELLIAIPIDQKLRPGQTRSVQRRALAGTLPPTLVGRRGKGNPSESICRALAREATTLRDMFDASLCIERGYVTHGSVIRALDAAAAGLPQVGTNLLSVLSLEHWLRSLQTRDAGSSFVAAPGRAHPAAAITMERARAAGRAGEWKGSDRSSSELNT